MKLLKEEDGIKYYSYDSIAEKEKHVKNMRAIGYQIFATDGDLSVAFYREYEVKVENLE